jgi:hypothetical protein
MDMSRFMLITANEGNQRKDIVHSLRKQRMIIAKGVTCIRARVRGNPRLRKWFAVCQKLAL